MGAAPGRVTPNTNWAPPLPAGRAPRRRAQSGHTMLGVGHLRRATPLHAGLPTPGRAKEPRRGGCANRVFAPTGVSVRFRRCAACRWRGPWPGAPLRPDREHASRSLAVEVPYAGRPYRKLFPMPVGGDDRAIDGQHCEVKIRAVGLGAESVRRESGDRRSLPEKRVSQEGPDQVDHDVGDVAAFDHFAMRGAASGVGVQPGVV